MCGLDEMIFRQLQWNLASRTSVYKRIVCGARIPDRQVYQRVSTCVLLIGGSAVSAGDG